MSDFNESFRLQQYRDWLKAHGYKRAWVRWASPEEEALAARVGVKERGPRITLLIGDDEGERAMEASQRLLMEIGPDLEAGGMVGEIPGGVIWGGVIEGAGVPTVVLLMP